MADLTSICVFCGSRPGNDANLMRDANTLGTMMANDGIRLIYGGGNTGLMGGVARGALDAGGKVTGIIPDFLISKERIGNSLDELDEVLITRDMHERKMLMFEKADAFIALPGGIGTLEELVEQLTWVQLGQHRKPVLIADIAGFWRPFFNLIDHMASQDFIGGDFDVTYLKAHTVDDILPQLKAALAPIPDDELAEAADIRDRM